MSRRDDYLREIERRKDAQRTQTLVMCFMLSALKKEFGFGHDRLMRVLNGASEEAGYIDSGMIGWREYIQSVQELTGIVIDEIEVTENEKRDN